MKKFNLLMLIGTLTFGGLASSCSFFGNDPYSIEDVNSILNEDGTTTVTISFTEGAGIPDYVFTLPKGQDGKGIKNVVATPNEDNTLMNVVITFTDDTTYNFSLPIVKGEDGVGIEAITDRVNEETGEKEIVISYTDPSKEPTIITLPKGEEGRGIVSIVYNQDPVTLELTLTITYSDQTATIIPIPRPNGVSRVEASVDPLSGNTILIFYLTDGTMLDPVVIGRSTSWYQGSEPPSSDLGYNGDFYFNTDALIIYTKENNMWKIVINFKDSMQQETYTVKFSLNAGDDLTASFNGYESSYEIAAGKNFYYENISVPTPTRSNYRFGGWYTEAVYNINLGNFTNFTNVYRDMTLFAYWISE